MRSDWKAVELGAVADLLTGFPFKSGEYSEDSSAPRLLRGDNIAQGVLRWDGAKRWPKHSTGGLDQYWLREGDVILAMDRPWIEAGLKYGAIRETDLPALLVQRVARLRGTKHLDNVYLKYLIASPEFTEYVLSVETGTAVPHISGNQIKAFKFALPPVAEQRAIGCVLGALDEKIELNRRMNETLESMTRALFKSWFVDFDPVRAKVEGRNSGLPKQINDLFPARLVGAEIGETPEGWEVSIFESTAELVRTQANPFEAPDRVFSHYSIPAFDNGRMPLTETGTTIKSMKFSVPTGAVLFSKLNPAIERVWLVDPQPSKSAVCSTEFLVLRPKAPFGRCFLYCLLRSRNFREAVNSLVTGTSNSHQRARADGILETPIALPPAGLAERFEDLADPLLDRTLANRRHSQTLTKAREALLPKLISGKLRVNDVKRFVKDVN
jgi:type I restriction enzyme, S subunit